MLLFRRHLCSTLQQLRFFSVPTPLAHAFGNQKQVRVVCTAPYYVRRQPAVLTYLTRLPRGSFARLPPPGGNADGEMEGCCQRASSFVQRWQRRHGKHCRWWISSRFCASSHPPAKYENKLKPRLFCGLILPSRRDCFFFLQELR